MVFTGILIIQVVVAVYLEFLKIAHVPFILSLTLFFLHTVSVIKLTFGVAELTVIFVFVV
jgi:hypothetical protein